LSTRRVIGEYVEKLTARGKWRFSRYASKYGIMCESRSKNFSSGCWAIRQLRMRWATSDHEVILLRQEYTFLWLFPLPSFPFWVPQLAHITSQNLLMNIYEYLIRLFSHQQVIMHSNLLLNNAKNVFPSYLSPSRGAGQRLKHPKWQIREHKLQLSRSFSGTYIRHWKHSSLTVLLSSRLTPSI